MKFNEQLNANGNRNRILEMHEGGCGPNTISGFLKDHNVNISATDVSAIIRTSPELAKPAIPKKAVRALIRQMHQEEQYAQAFPA